MLARMWRKGETWYTVACKLECKLVQPLWKAVERFLKKLKIEIPCPEILPPGMYPKKMKTLIQKDTCHIYCSIIYNSQHMATA